MNIVSRYQTDEQKEVAGVWVPYGEGAELKIARMNNRRYEEFIDRETAKYRQASGLGMVSTEVWEGILIDAMSRTILVDWKGVKEGPVGQEVDVPYAQDTAKRYLAIKDFRESVAQTAKRMELFKKQELETLEKNS